MKKILVVEDDRLLNKTLVFNLAADGYETASAFSCDETRRLLAKEDYALVLLDINLPDGSGLELCREIREKSGDIYVVFLTANDRERDQLNGYKAGGSDYITKPFSVAVLGRKVEAIFRSMEQHCPCREIFDDGFLRIDFTAMNASLDGKSIEFTPQEYRTLALFVRHPHRILTKRQLLEKLWDINGDFVDEHALASIISRIRKKIENDNRKYIRTSYGIGYQWTGGDRNI